MTHSLTHSLIHLLAYLLTYLNIYDVDVKSLLVHQFLLFFLTSGILIVHCYLAEIIAK